MQRARASLGAHPSTPTWYRLEVGAGGVIVLSYLSPLGTLFYPPSIPHAQLFSQLGDDSRSKIEFIYFSPSGVDMLVQAVSFPEVSDLTVSVMDRRVSSG